MTTRASIFALTTLAAASAMAIAATPASADGRFLAPRPIFTPGQVVANCNGDPRLGCAVHVEPNPPTQVVVANCNGDPRLGCAVHVEPAPSMPVGACPFGGRVPVRAQASIPYEVRGRVRIPGPFATRIYPRHHVWY